MNNLLMIEIIIFLFIKNAYVLTGVAVRDWDFKMQNNCGYLK